MFVVYINHLNKAYPNPKHALNFIRIKTDLQTNIIERIIIRAMIPGTPSMSAHLRSSPLHDRVSLSNGSHLVT